MNTSPLSPRKALNKALLKVKPKRTEIELFKTNLISLLDSIREDEHEEFHKNLVIDFLKNTWYKDRHFVNTKGRNDLVIHNGPKSDSTVGVIIEAKSPTKKAEMVSVGHLNRKALHELVLYYLRERITHNNLAVKHLVITNINEWFLFDAVTFDRIFAQNKVLVDQFKDFEAKQLSEIKTDFFYKSIAEPFIASLTSEIEYTHFNLQDYLKPLRNADKTDDAKLIALFKILSPEHLLKQPVANDGNSLNRHFYSELLHIIGLTEIKDKGKKLIQRAKDGERNPASLLEAAVVQLDSLDKITRLKNPSQYGANTSERLFNVALELTITWVNRILFLKLLEAQLLTYHKGDRTYAFLNSETIKDYDDLQTLFFQVLARRHEERNGDVKSLFAKVPYLNSSLFEPTEFEQDMISISNLSNGKTIPILGATVLKTADGKKRTGSMETLDYLFAFLDAYDFSSEGTDEIQEESKTLINASVLGLIFEKINGYKDGSFFTPSFITMYMCRETIRKAIVQKFNEVKGWNCASIDDVYDKIEDRREANEIVNSLTICDPAVGSGHFLVSALNELIAVKSDLKILMARDGKRLKEYQVDVVNDELIVTDEDGELFEYKPRDRESQRVQEALFHEKQTLIENCLFGVDINPNSVKICRLRLWIELLKNAYYKNETELETLPNIDINIKCGNSLVSRFALDADLKQALKKSRYNIDTYRVAVATYRNAVSKDEKREMERLIADIKSDFRSDIASNDPKVKKLAKLSGELTVLTTQTQLFEQTKKEKSDWTKKVDQLTLDIRKLETEIEEIRSNKIFENAFEWRFEFPEVLNEEGDFVGFDVVIGNPPYIRQEEFTDIKDYLKSRFVTYAGTADLYVYFVEQSFNTLRKGGFFSFIIPNKWLRTGYGTAMRNYLNQLSIDSITDFGDLPVFEEATTYPSVIEASKQPSSGKIWATNLSTLIYPEGLGKFIADNRFEVISTSLSPECWTLSESRSQKLLDKLRHKGVPLSEYTQGHIYRGVLTGLNEAFVIDEATRNQLINEDTTSKELIKPFLAGRDIKRYERPLSNKYLIFSKRGVDINRYPAISKHLMRFRASLEPKPLNHDEAISGIWKGRKSGSYKWYEIQDAVDYHNEFEKPKIIYPNICRRPEFTLDLEKNYANQKCFIITNYSLTLLGILNSNLYLFLFKSILPKLRGDFYEPSYAYLKDFPVMSVNSPEIDILVSECLEMKKINPTADTTEIEYKIDKLVYQLFELTEEEIRIVEGA